MARSEFITKLPLDRWGQIMGVSPLALNQLYSDTLFQNTTCGDVWYQDSWQHSDRVGRNDLAQAIQAAEQEIERELGYNLIPEWTVDERLEYPKPGQPGAFNVSGNNPRGMYKSVEARKGWVISGGFRAKTLIQAGAAVVRTDADVDGYAETCTVTVPTTLTDTNEIRVYYPAKSGEDAWEIKPLTSVAISGGNAVVTFKSWQIAAANHMDALDAQPLDADNAASYETTVDVYRVYNDVSTQVQMMWENSGDCCDSCAACEFDTQTGCFHLRDDRLGIVVPAPATWDATNQEFTATEFALCREPDQVRLWYYSGYRDWGRKRPYVEMWPYFEYMVAYYAASKLDRPVCGCSNLSEFVERWRRDATFADKNSGGFVLTPEFAANKLGTSVGALYAYRRLQQNGIRVSK